MQKSTPKRTRFLIDPKVQWSLAIRVLGHWAMLILCLVMVNSVISLLMMAGQRPLTGALGEALRQQTPLIAVLVVLVPVFVRDTLKMSNRFAGPMYRLRTELAKVNQGVPASPIKLRDRDFWQPVADDFNGVLAKMETLQSENEALRQQIRAQGQESDQPATV
ncbi:MAG: hypothetical protein AAF989_04235 [Planctomycetota bacterium]